MIGIATGIGGFCLSLYLTRYLSKRIYESALERFFFIKFESLDDDLETLKKINADRDNIKFNRSLKPDSSLDSMLLDFDDYIRERYVDNYPLSGFEFSKNLIERYDLKLNALRNLYRTMDVFKFQ